MSDNKSLKALTAALALPLVFGVSAAYAQDQDTTQVAPEAPAVVQPQDKMIEPAPNTAAEPGIGTDQDVVAPAPETIDETPAPAASAKAPPADLAIKLGDLIGKPVFAADGKKIGTVTGMTKGANGDIKTVHVRTFGFFGFGAKTVAVPADNMQTAGKEVRIAMASPEFNKLPLAPNS